MKIIACPKCGSTDISAGTMGSGVTFGVTSWNYTCRNCNYRGQPLEFDSKETYQKFLSGMRGKETPSSTVEEKIDNLLDETGIDKEFKELVEEAASDTNPLCDEHPFQNKKWWPDFIIAIFFSLIITFFLFAPNLLNIMTSTEVYIYIIFLFIFWIIILMVFLVIIEYFIVQLRRKFCK